MDFCLNWVLEVLFSSLARLTFWFWYQCVSDKSVSFHQRYRLGVWVSQCFLRILYTDLSSSWAGGFCSSCLWNRVTRRGVAIRLCWESSEWVFMVKEWGTYLGIWVMLWPLIEQGLHLAQKYFFLIKYDHFWKVVSHIYKFFLTLWYHNIVKWFYCW